jgi:hypothetical protein
MYVNLDMVSRHPYVIPHTPTPLMTSPRLQIHVRTGMIPWGPWQGIAAYANMAAACVRGDEVVMGRCIASSESC